MSTEIIMGYLAAAAIGGLVTYFFNTVGRSEKNENTIPVGKNGGNGTVSRETVEKIVGTQIIGQRAVCTVEIEHIKAELIRGDEKFERIESKIDGYHAMVSRLVSDIDGRIRVLEHAEGRPSKRS